MKVFTSSSRHNELGPGQALPPPPWYQRTSILIAAAALIAGVGIVVSGAGEPGTAPDGTTRTSAPRSASFSLIATGWIPTPEPAPPPAAAPPAAEPSAPAPPAAGPPVAPPVAAPPPPPRSELLFRSDNSTMADFVSITYNADKPAVNCVLRSVAVAGPAASINYDHSDNFTVTGSAEARIDYHGPATGSTFHNTVTCDNGLSTSQDGTY